MFWVVDNFLKRKKHQPKQGMSYKRLTETLDESDDALAMSMLHSDEESSLTKKLNDV